MLLIRVASFGGFLMGVGGQRLVSIGAVKTLAAQSSSPLPSALISTSLRRLSLADLHLPPGRGRNSGRERAPERGRLDAAATAGCSGGGSPDGRTRGAGWTRRWMDTAGVTATAMAHPRLRFARHLRWKWEPTADAGRGRTAARIRGQAHCRERWWSRCESRTARIRGRAGQIVAGGGFRQYRDINGKHCWF